MTAVERMVERQTADVVIKGTAMHVTSSCLIPANSLVSSDEGLVRGGKLAREWYKKKNNKIHFN